MIPVFDVPAIPQDGGTFGPDTAPLMVVGETYGEHEARVNRPFVGPSGQLLRRLLARVKEPIFITNVANRQPPGNDYTVWTGSGTPVGNMLLAEPLVTGLSALRAQLERMPNVRRILALGNLALWALTDGLVTGKKLSGIMQWRGSQLYLPMPDGRRIELLPTVHPAAVLRQPDWQIYLQADISRFLHVTDWAPPPEHFVIRPSLPEVLEWLADPADPVAVDIETAGGHISCVGLSRKPGEAICIPLAGDYWSREDELAIRRALRAFLRSHRLIGQNFLFDSWFFRAELLGIVDCWLDTLVAHHLLFPGTPRSLDFLSSFHCAHHVYWKGDRASSSDDLWRYNCRDASKTVELGLILQAKLEAAGLWHLYEEERRPTWRLCRDMMFRGFLFDVKDQQAFHDELTRAVHNLEEMLQRAAPHLPVWWRSSKKTCRLFYEELGIPVIRSRKTGNPTTGKTVLEDIVKKAPETYRPFVRALIGWLREIRSAEVWRNTFLSAPPDPDSRFRSFLDPAGTETFRFSSSATPTGRGGNMQNLPKDRFL